jgi:DNA-3-methyladenine glycosylase II
VASHNSTPTPAALRALARRDPVLGREMKALPRFPGFPQAADKRGTFYESLTRAICYQQLTGKAAATIHGRVCALTPGARFPRPDEVARLPATALRGAGLSRAKVASITDLAARVRTGELKLRGLSRLTDDEVIERLVQVRGIGVWSAQMFLMFRLGRLDVMPATDLGVQEGIRLLDGDTERPKPDRALARAEAWRPLRSVGAWLMWRHVEAVRARAT